MNAGLGPRGHRSSGACPQGESSAVAEAFSFSSAGTPSTGGRRLLISTLVVTAAAILLMSFAGNASAAAPANDDFANAEVVNPALPANVAGSNVEATVEANEEDHYPNVYDSIKSVWYSFTPAASGAVKIDVCDHAGNTTVVVYTGTTLGSLTKVAGALLIFNGASRCSISASVSAGTTYMIAVDAFVESAFTLEITGLVPPANDNFADAETIGPAVPSSLAGTTTGASAEDGEPDHSYDSPSPLAPNQSVWYSFTPASSGQVTFNSCSHTGALTYPSFVAAYTGSALGSLTRVAGGKSHCSINLDATAGTTYRIVVDAYVDGDFTLKLRNPPANDNLSDAETVGPLPVSVPGTGTDASMEDDETGNLAGVWYSFTATSTGTVEVDCLGSAYIQIYTGSSHGSLSLVTSQPRAACKVTLNAVAGTTYRIKVTSTGDFTLRLREPLGNDDFANALVIGPSLPASDSGSTLGATAEAGEEQHSIHGSDQHAVWYSFTPATSGEVEISMCNFTNDGLVAVYSGTTLGSLTREANWGTSDECRVTLNATASVEYRIAVENDVTFDFTLIIRGRPDNDAFADAEVLSPPESRVGTTAFSSMEPSEENHYMSGPPPTGSVWYSLTAAGDGVLELNTCGNGNQGVVVYTGAALGSLTRVAGDGGACTVSVLASSGTTYLIAVATSGGRGFILDADLGAPDNDHFADATPLGSSLPVSQAGVNVGATAESGEPGHGLNQNLASSSVWYGFTPSVTGVLTIDTCNSDFDTVLSVYAGAALDDLSKVMAGDDECETPNTLGSSIEITLTAGTQYWIAVDRYSAASPTGEFTLVITDTTPPAEPTLDSTTPDSPANNNNPKIVGSAESGSTIRLYTDAACSVPIGSATAEATFESPGIAVNVTDDSTTTFHATATDASGNTSACSTGSITYVEDSTFPDAPVITETDPASPSPDVTPLVKGTNDASTTSVEIFTDNDCGGDSPGTGTSGTTFEGAGIEVTAAANQTGSLSAFAYDAAGNVSACSTAFNYTHDDIAPAAPVITGADPASPSAEATPLIKGSTDADTAFVSLFKSADCTGFAINNDSRAIFEGAGIGAPVTVNQTSALSARAIDAAGNFSACSNTIDYIHDDIAPAAPVITATDPASPGNVTNPLVKGTADADSEAVLVYIGANCTGVAYGAGRSDFVGAGIEVAVDANTTTQLSAEAFDAAGNTSSCSSSIVYTHDSIPPDTTIDSGPSGTITTNEATFTFAAPRPVTRPRSSARSTPRLRRLHDPQDLHRPCRRLPHRHLQGRGRGRKPRCDPGHPDIHS